MKVLREGEVRNLTEKRRRNRTAFSKSQPERAENIRTTRRAPIIRKAGFPKRTKTPNIAKFVSYRRSLTVFDLELRTLTLTQIDEWGKEIERITISKG